LRYAFFIGIHQSSSTLKGSRSGAVFIKEPRAPKNPPSSDSIGSSNPASRNHTTAKLLWTAPGLSSTSSNPAQIPHRDLGSASGSAWAAHFSRNSGLLDVARQVCRGIAARVRIEREIELLFSRKRSGAA